VNYFQLLPQIIQHLTASNQATGDYASLLSGSAALALRAATAILVTGWSPSISLNKPAELNEYALELGPFYLKDSSAATKGELVRPREPIVLYEYDASPFCRKVREACAILDLEVLCKPCPGARQGFSDELFELTGRRTVPCLVDSTNGVDYMFESDDIINHLFDTYGLGATTVPFTLKGTFATLTCGLAALARGMPASSMLPGTRPDTSKMIPLTIFGYEPSPFVKPVREKLCSLGLPHLVINTARGSVNRAKLIERTGKQFQVPYLIDPNTGVELFESIEIQKYLDDVYRSEVPPS
jgi:glutathione S-transferase